MEISLNEALRKISTSNENNIQLDFFRENGQVLAQIFRQKNVKKWGGEVLVKDDGLIMELNFNDEKLNNKTNLIRFKESKFYNLFQQSQSRLGQSYVIGINGNESVKDIVDLIHKVFFTFYQVPDYKFTIRVY